MVHLLSVSGFFSWVWVKHIKLIQNGTQVMVRSFFSWSNHGIFLFFLTKNLQNQSSSHIPLSKLSLLWENCPVMEDLSLNDDFPMDFPSHIVSLPEGNHPVIQHFILVRWISSMMFPCQKSSTKWDVIFHPHFNSHRWDDFHNFPIRPSVCALKKMVAIGNYGCPTLPPSFVLLAYFSWATRPGKR